MSKPKTIRDAALKALKQRWYPMVKMQTLYDMNNLFNRTYCAVCSFHSELECLGCPMNTGKSCSKAYTRWDRATENGKFNLASKAAKDVVKELEAIAGVTHDK